MPLHSMTGFARASIQTGEININWEARSVNGKGLDIRFRLPFHFDGIEYDLRKKMGAVLSRGSINILLSVTFPNAGTSLVINAEYLEKIIEISDKLHEQYGLTKPSIDGLLSLKGVMETSDSASDLINIEQFKPILFSTFDSLLTDLVHARQSEGDVLKIILLTKVDEIAVLSKAAREDPSRSADAIRERLKNNIATLMEVGVTFDVERLHTEAILLATKADIQEELDRLDSHVGAARSLLLSGGVVGRKLDFLAQEFNREANTLCSKANSPSLSAIGLSLKALIDQWREQIQNLE